MEIMIKNLNPRNLVDIPHPCRSCLYWEFPGQFEELRRQKPEVVSEKKRKWFMRTLKEFGSCGKVVYKNKVPIGYTQYGPSSRLPQARNYRSGSLGRIADGTIFLSCLYLSEEKIRRRGVGTELLNSVIIGLRERSFRAIETFARRASANNPSGPLKFYLRRGFRIKDETDPEFPLVRLELQG